MIESHLIVGNDADLVVIAMSLPDIANISILFREKNTYVTIDIDKLQCNISSKYHSQISLDFVLLSILNGNDYLPKLGYATFDKLWTAYGIITDLNMVPLINESGIYNRNNIICFLQILINLLDVKFRSYRISTYNEDGILNYLEGLLWNIRMYNTGKCTKYDYTVFDKKFPEPLKLLHYFEFNTNNINIPTSLTPAIPSDIYTILVLPKYAQPIIPTKFHSLMNGKLKHLYEKEECIHCKDNQTLYNSLNQQLYQANKNKIASEIKVIRENLGKTMIKITSHKYTHNNEFNISKIIKCCIII